MNGAKPTCTNESLPFQFFRVFFPHEFQSANKIIRNIEVIYSSNRVGLWSILTSISLETEKEIKSKSIIKEKCVFLFRFPVVST